MDMKLDLEELCNSISQRADELDGAATKSITKLLEHKFYRIIDVEKQENDFDEENEKIVFTLEDQKKKVHLTDFWCKELLPDYAHIKKLIGKKPHEIAFLGMVPYMSYQRADIKIRKIRK